MTVDPATPATPATPAAAPAEAIEGVEAVEAQPALAADLCSRFERTAIGRAAVLLTVLVLLSVMVIDNLPNSALRSELLLGTAGIERQLGIHQDWPLFAPDPPQTQWVMATQVEYDDGSAAAWVVPQWGGLTGSYDEYRWRKWGEAVVRFTDTERLRATALAVGRLASRPGRTVTRVTLFARINRVSDGKDQTTDVKELISVEVETP